MTFRLSLEINIGDIEFQNVSFAYPKTDAEAVKKVNISVKGGSTVAALVGHSGAGKSTIINLTT